MKKNLIILAVLASLVSFGYASTQKLILAKINNYEITHAEFLREFQESPYAREDTYESKKEFLDFIVSRKLILQDAQKMGLDKDEKFLKMIENFWEQSLLKLALEEKSKEVATGVFVSDKEIEEAYQKMLSEGKTDKPYDAAYNQIKWQITQARQTELLNAWIARLRQNARIKLNYNFLKNDIQ